MVPDLIDKYVWLIQTLLNAGPAGLTLSQLSRKWCSRYSQSDYPRRTFNNHREAIAQIFGIEILCNRSENRYYIENGEDSLDQDASRNWLINTFTVSNLLSLSKERLTGRVSVENIPSGQSFLTQIIEAMNEGHPLRIAYLKYNSSDKEELDVDPYAVKETDKRWYLVGYCHQRNALRVYGLDRIESIEILNQHFELPDNFDVDELFAPSYGVFLPNDGQKAETITFRTSAKEAKYLKDLPFHPSQTVISEKDDEVTFRLHLIPNEALILDLCRLGSRIEILTPEHLRERIKEEHQKAIEKYIK